jgi:hypothetical protein
VTVRGTAPVEGVADITAVGGWLLTTSDTRQHVISASYPPVAHTSAVGRAVTQTVASLEKASHNNVPFAL